LKYLSLFRATKGHLFKRWQGKVNFCSTEPHIVRMFMSIGVCLWTHTHTHTQTWQMLVFYRGNPSHWWIYNLFRDCGVSRQYSDQFCYSKFKLFASEFITINKTQIQWCDKTDCKENLKSETYMWPQCPMWEWQCLGWDEEGNSKLDNTKVIIKHRTCMEISLWIYMYKVVLLRFHSGVHACKCTHARARTHTPCNLKTWQKSKGELGPCHGSGG
jgi:hypothetical protein